MYCEKCGAKNDSSSKFCEKCGNKFETEVKETKKTTTVKKDSNTPSLKDKFNTLSSKQKIIGGIVLALIVIFIVFYVVGSKMTSLETIGTKAFEQLADKSKIDNKYLSVPLNSEDYFVSLEDVMKNTIEDEEIKFDYKSYTVTAGTKKVTIKYKDTEEDEKYKVVFEVEKEGKSLLLFDKYVITKITVEKDDYDYATLYNPEETEKLTLSTIKDSKIFIDDKEVSKDYIDKKKSDDKNDVYVIKGMSKGDYEVKFGLGKLTFEKKVYVYSESDNEYDLTNYISYSYLADDNKDFAKEFKTYVTTYYEYVNSDKTVEDFDKKYKVNDDIKEVFADSKEYASNVSSFKITDVTVRSLYYYSTDDELVVSYKVNYTYKLASSEEEKTSYDSVRVTYDLSNTEIPVDLSYMPY